MNEDGREHSAPCSEQTTGAAMGSPLSPVLANIFMEDFEQKALANSNLVPSIWKRFVDDIFAVWSHGDEQLLNFLNHLKISSTHWRT